MSYRIGLAAGATATFHGLPESAQDALISRFVDLIEAPWDGTHVLGGVDPASREATFDNGRGLLGLHVDDTAEFIRIFNILWVA